MKTVEPHHFNPANYARRLANDIIYLENIQELPLADPDWWQQVLIELHDQLAENFLLDDESGGRYLTVLEQRAKELGVPRPAPASTPTPPPNFSLHKATPPWVKPADSTPNAPWKNAPPSNQDESNSNLRELLARFNAERREAEQVANSTNVLLEKIQQLQERLNALEARTPC